MRFVLICLGLLFLCAPLSAYAECAAYPESLPSVGYKASTNEMLACDGTNWVSVAGSSSGSAAIPIKTTAERNAMSASAGTIIYNSTSNRLEWSDGSKWYMPSTSTQEIAQYASCKEILDAGASTGDGTYLIDPAGDDIGFQAYCDMSTDGGGWTIFAAYTGGNGEQPFVSNIEISGNPLSFAHYNINRAKKMVLSAISSETLLRRNNGVWIKTDHAPFDSNLDTANSDTSWSVSVTASDGTTASGYMGYANHTYGGGGDYGIATTAGFDHHNSTYYYNLNNVCSNMYFYGYSSASIDYDAGYDTNTTLGSWSATNSCNSNEGGVLVFYAAMR